MDTAIQFRGTIYENGYGLVAQKVMRDLDLSPQAKSIYSYICSFAEVGKDGERTAFPGVELMMKELGFKLEKTYYKHRKQLINKGYITIEKRKDKGKFEKNLYFIEAIPSPIEEKQPHGKNYSTEKTEQQNLPHGNFSTLQNESG
ncbi:helix-turn-helix domain-containing protein [Virgibacillus sp. AGTR]|uniref:helix-turn-helix domain-containing protein n=1 Tax=Virgibacillus sp. AGTR TaxID=2812055 RepID=UPI001D16BE0D|nr:helix-turn-helix domain-containing protein [Virgibacillus sp. AGTR]MCC2248995.1 helix-turn-helix domain-containing protein [Virgibacillus sp. AGTR]